MILKTLDGHVKARSLIGLNTSLKNYVLTI